MNDSPPRVPSHGLSRAHSRHTLLGRVRRSFAPTPVSFDPARLRENCARALPVQVHEQLRRLAGPTIEWWADRTPGAITGLPRATVLGRRGLVVALPIDFDPIAPVYSLTAYQLGEAVESDVTHRPAPDDEPDVVRYAPFIGLNPEHRELLAILPAQAAFLLQQPFLASSVERCDWHFEGAGDDRDRFMVHLAGPGLVTVGYGSRVVPAGHTPDTAHWSLRIHVARVVRRETVLVS